MRVLVALLIISILLLLGATSVLINQRVNKPDESLVTIGDTPLKNIYDGEVKQLSLETFFDDRTPDISSYPKDSVITLIATGDILPGRSVNYKSLQYNNFRWAYEFTADLLGDSDVTFVNLEAPLVKNCPVTNEGMIFCGDARHVQGLTYAGVDVVNLGNNHAGNHGMPGVKETIDVLESANIKVVGALNNPKYVDVRGTTIAFLGYDDITPQQGVSSASNEHITQEVSQASKNADITIVQLHWGSEYQSQPNDRQKELARLVVDSGADMVIGNHPHWIQPIEIYKNKLITYAHGNFIFDQMWSEKTREGVVGKYYFYENHLIDAEFIPTKIYDYGQAKVIEDQEYRNKILREMYHESQKLRSH